jgi:hypothetical protein
LVIFAEDGVLDNDEDQDGDTLEAVKVSNPPSNAGTVVLGATGEFSFNPFFDFVGTTSFTYYASDGLLPSETVTVTIHVNESNDPPTEITLSNNSLAENLPEGSTIGTFDTLDPDELDSFDYELVSGVGDTDNAQFTINGDTLVSGAEFDYETKNSYSIRVRSTDQGGLWVENSFLITITPVNDSPVAYDQDLETDQGTAITITLEGWDQEGDSLDFALVGAAPANGTMPWTPPVLTYTPDASFKGIDYFYYRVIDEHDASSNTAKITIKVIGDTCLEVSPSSLSQVLEVNATGSQVLTVTNTCGYEVPFTMDKTGVFLFEEGFEAGVMPPPGGWETIHNGDTENEWVITEIDNLVYQGNYAALIEYDSNKESDEWLLTPVIDTSDLSNLMLSFWAYSNTNWPDATMQVWVTDEQGDVITTYSTEPIWDLIFDEDWDINAHRKVTLDLADYAGYGPIRIAWRYYGMNGDSFALDNVAITGSSIAPWLSMEPSAATVAGYGTLPVDILFNSNGLELGQYSAAMILLNEPYPSLNVPVTLNVVSSGTNFIYLSLILR